MTGSLSDAATGVILMADCGVDPLGELFDRLTALGYRVYTATGEEAVIKAARTYLPDLIVINAQQFEAGQARLCKLVKKHSQTRSIPVIMVGRQNSLDQRLQAFEAGIVDYITAPFWTEELVARIKTQVLYYKRQRRLQLQAQRAISGGNPVDLLADLQRALRRQAQLLQHKNDQLHQEMAEREQAQADLRLEQQKSEQLLLNILPQAVVAQLKQLQGSLAERFEDVTILFADIVNFTPLAAQTSPLELVNWLNQIFSTFDRLSEQFQLEKIKTIGDEYMVVGGLPVPRPDHAEAVMEMALAMQQVAHGFSRQDGQPFEIRIGINTGPVVAGVIGIKKFSYDLWGDAVNLASRMESQGQPGKIQVTEATYQRLCHRYQFEQVGEVLVKGHGYMTAYQYVGPR